MRALSPIRTLARRLGWRPSPVVPVLRLEGVIGTIGPLRRGLALAQLARAVEAAFAVPDAKAVAIVVNSPGGSPVQADLIHRRIRALAEEKKRPVLAFVEDVAASGGYWIALAADEIFVNQASIVGSIGVVTAGFGFPRLLRQLGVERRLYAVGPRKAMLDPFSPEDPDDVAHLRAIQAELHEAFKVIVRARRGERLKAPEAELFSGAFWTGRRGVELGLVDGEAELRQELRRRFGERVKLRPIGLERGLLRRLGLARGLERLPEATIAAIEERAAWARYGL